MTLRLLLVSLVSIIVCGLAIFVSTPAEAQVRGSGAISFTFSATTTAARIQKSGQWTRYQEVRCWNSTTTPVYLGSKADAVYPICSSVSCPESSLSVSVSGLYAKSSSGSVALTCIAIR